MSNFSRGIAFSNDGNKLLVSDGTRILIWNTIPDTSGAPADLVIGANDLNDDGSGNSGVTANRFHFVEDLLISPDNKLIVCDYHRLLIFNKIPESNNASADVVIFQPDFDSEETGLSDRRTTGYVRQAALSGDGRLFVAISDQNRVLVFNKVPTKNDTPADMVLGSDDLFSVRQYNSNELSTYMGAIGVAVSPDHILAVGGASYTCECSRVLLYKGLPTFSGQLPDYVLGQPDLNTVVYQSNSQKSIDSSVLGLTFDNNGHLYVCASLFPGILVFDLKNDEYTAAPSVKAHTTLNIYPNPARGSFSIKVPGDRKIDEISVFDIRGKLFITNSLGKPVVRSRSILT